MKTRLLIIIGIMIATGVTLLVLVIIPNLSGFFDERCYQGQVWLIEYEYSSFSFPTTLTEKKTLKRNHSI